VKTGAKMAVMIQNMTMQSPTTAILDANRKASPFWMRLKIPGFASTISGAVADAVSDMVAPKHVSLGTRCI
jgi:hypothetical protein